MRRVCEVGGLELECIFLCLLLDIRVMEFGRKWEAGIGENLYSKTVIDQATTYEVGQRLNTKQLCCVKTGGGNYA